MKKVLPHFIFRIFKGVSPSEEGTGIMSIIIRKPYGHLEEELIKTFKGQKDVQIIVDKRYGERRKTQQDIEKERRHDNRRQPKDEIVDVVLSV